MSARAGQPYSLYDEGKGVAGYKKFTNAGMLQGTWYINMSNDNNFQGIDATVKVIVIIEMKTYEDKEYIELVVTPKYEKKIFRGPIINTQQVPVTEM